MFGMKIRMISFGVVCFLLLTALPTFSVDFGKSEEVYASQTTMKLTTKTKNAGASKTVTYATVHDPSIVKDPKTGRYYIFGSHMAWAYSDDLQNWTYFKNNINREFKSLFKKAFDWARMGDSVYREDGNLWAPDVIWNPAMNKWCMYMSINGVSWNSSIALLTADSLEGDWEYEGIVVYSGMTASNGSHDFRKTDYRKVTGEKSLNSRYIGPAYTCRDGNTATKSTTWKNSYGAHAIDPCVFFDSKGTLYMSYGSWSGGIYLLQLDSKTGLRDYRIKYTTKNNVSDSYMGYKIAGGSFVSGEASYIQKIGKYYYLFETYGGLTETGGYNMRLFRATKPTGPYLDESGQDARSTRAGNNINGNQGNRIMSYYRWSYMNKGYIAQGHNSVLLDDDGRIYLVYHTRFTDRNEQHQVRVHQMFVNQSGWLVAAPFEFSNEKLSKSIRKSQVAGSYEVLIHRGTNYSRKQCVTGLSLRFEASGKITGEKKGTWRWAKKGAPYVVVKLGKQIYEGVFIKQKMEPDNAGSSSIGQPYKHGTSVMCFTLLGKKDELAVWGYNNTKTFRKAKAPDLKLENEKNGVTVSWDSMGGAKGYELYRKVGTGKWKKIKTILKKNTVSCLDKTVPDGKTVQYRLRGITATGLKSAYSDEEKIVFVKPMSITNVHGISGGMTIRWGKQRNVSSYYIQYSRSPYFTFDNHYALVGNKTWTSAKITGLEKGKVYYVRMQKRQKVKARTYASGWSKVWKVTIA